MPLEELRFKYDGVLFGLHALPVRVPATPDVFDQDDDEFVTVLDDSPSGEAETTSRTAWGICPAQAITVYD